MNTLHVNRHVIALVLIFHCSFRFETLSLLLKGYFYGNYDKISPANDQTLRPGETIF